MSVLSNVLSLPLELGSLAMTLGAQLVVPDLDFGALGKKSKFDPTTNTADLAGKVIIVTGGG